MEEKELAGEFKSYLTGFTKLCDNYCENAKKVVPGTDYVKLVNIYQKGLAGSCAGLSRVLSEHYDSVDTERQRQMDEFVQLSGVLPLLEEANRVIGKHSLDSGALFSAGGIFEELKKIIKLIPGLTQLVVPFVGAIPGLLDLIDQFIEGIGKLFGPKTPSSGGPTVEHPPAIPHIDGMIPCQWYTVYEGKEPAEIDLFAGDVNVGAGSIEVKVDGKINPKRVESYWQTFKGNKIEVHLLPDKDFPKRTGDVGHRPHPH